MAATIDFSLANIRQLTSAQKKSALCLLARELLAEQPGLPLCVSDPLGDTGTMYVIGSSNFQFGPLEEFDTDSADEETQRRAKLADNPRNVIPIEVMIQRLAKPGNGQ